LNFVVSRQVRDLRDGQPPAVLLDVRLPEDFQQAHIAGALSLCVFEVRFVDEVRRLVPDLATPIVVYGAGPGSLESTDAARRLHEAGYTALHNFPGGLEDWKRDGYPTLGDGSLPVPPPDGTIPVDLAETRIEWTGRNLLNKHTGSVALKAGSLVFREGWLAGGELVIDMTSLRCTDLADPVQNAALLAHLVSADFFDVARHPEARLVIRKAGPVPNGRPGLPNLEFLGEFTLRGVTREIRGLAVAGRTPEGRAAAQAVLAFDRTDFGSVYGSGRFFRRLGRHLVNDLVEIQVRLLAGGP
jgi:rhodanese-related sulfurtransferase